jgi:orotate phosphoribosyltransferase
MRRHIIDVHVPHLDSVLLRAYDLAIFERDERSSRKPPKDREWALDMRIPLSRSDVLGPIAREMIAALHEADLSQIAGYGFGSYALLGAIVGQAPAMVGALIRESAKSYGFGEIVEGQLVSEAPVVIIDDLLATGRSALRAVAVLREHGFAVTAVYTVFRFDWGHGRSALRAEGISHKCLATVRKT